jgi:hypothetical protein
MTAQGAGAAGATRRLEVSDCLFKSMCLICP